MKSFSANASLVQIALSLGLLVGIVWEAKASELPDIDFRSPSSTKFLEQKDVKGSCRVHIHEIFESGKKNVKFNEVDSYSRGECKSEAMLRKISSEAKEDIKQVRVYFSFREPAVID
jgi:hypothetical protein